MGSSFMISERTFANTFSAFWSELLPASEGFLRNLKIKRFASPLPPSARPEVRALINEAGFLLFCQNVGLPSSRLVNEKAVERAIALSAERIHRFQTEARPAPELLKEDSEEVILIAERLSSFFKKRRYKNLLCSPAFNGCGIINSCEGDVLADATLVEIKAGDRNFRATDLRQVLTYCALNYASTLYDFNRIALVNPRKGIYLEESTNVLCRLLAGTSRIDVLDAIVGFSSEPRTSR
jgi:hypothetical protein